MKPGISLTLGQRENSEQLAVGEATFEPDPERAFAIDAALRARLADSFTYLDSYLARSRAPFVLTNFAARLRSGPVSPFLFCIYSDLVAALSREDEEAAQRAAAQLALAADHPASPGIVPYLGTSVPVAWWAPYHALLDTEPGRDFRPAAPTSAGLQMFGERYFAALRIMEECDPPLAKEVGALVRMVVPAAPSGTSTDQRFNGASTFLAWGATLLNSEIDRHPVAMVDLLVHESGHLLLFGLVEGGALTTNRPEERYSSPLRHDDRPIDGILHACFVSTRVHLAMSRLVESGALDVASVRVADEHRRQNGRSAVMGLEVLNSHAQPTPKGQVILASLNAYWSRFTAG